MSSETEDSDSALKPALCFNLLHAEKKKMRGKLMEKAAEVRGKSNETVRDAHGGGHGGNRAVNVMLSTLLHC